MRSKEAIKCVRNFVKTGSVFILFILFKKKKMWFL